MKNNRPKGSKSSSCNMQSEKVKARIEANRLAKQALIEAKEQDNVETA